MLLRHAIFAVRFRLRRAAPLCLTSIRRLFSRRLHAATIDIVALSPPDAADFPFSPARRMPALVIFEAAA